MIKLEIEGKPIIASGFLLKFCNSDTQDTFYCLMSNEHVITKNAIQNKDKIYIYYDNKSKTREIQLNENERYIKSFRDIGLDITVVEILDKENISIDYFLEPLLDVNNITLINSNIYRVQYPKRNELMFSIGKIKEINKYEFSYLPSEGKGSSGSPIFLENDIKVLGIHIASSNQSYEMYGEFIYPVINLVKNDISGKRNNNK